MKKTLAMLVATTALTAAIGLPAWSAMRTEAGAQERPFAAVFNDGQRRSHSFSSVMTMTTTIRTVGGFAKAMMTTMAMVTMTKTMTTRVAVRAIRLRLARWRPRRTGSSATARPRRFR